MLTREEYVKLSKEMLEVWRKMDLSDVHGWPLWEKEVFQILEANYDEVRRGRAPDGAALRCLSTSRRLWLMAQP